MGNADDLSGLINEANSEVETGIQQAKAAKPKRRRRTRDKVAPLLPALLFTSAYFIYSTQQPAQSDTEASTSELTNLLRQARELVEASTIDGKPPPVLPNAALATIVNYQAYRGGYLLSVQSTGVLVEMDSLGNVSVESAGSR